MYVIQVNATRNTGSSDVYDVGGHVLGTTANATISIIIPADRCSWVQGDTVGGGYSISDVRFYDGEDPDGETASGDAVPASVTVQTRLGYIGKSGRFTAMTN